MSYNPDDHTNERRTAVALEAIAEALEDYLRLTLSAQVAATIATGFNPDAKPMIQPILDAIAEIKERRGWT